MNDERPLPAPTRGRYTLAVCFAMIGASGTWLLSGVLPGSLRGWIAFGTALAAVVAGLLGLWLARRARESPHRWALFSLEVLGAGAVMGFVLGAACCAVESVGKWPAAPIIGIYGAIFGTILAAVCFSVPLGLVYWAYTQLGRAREGSLIDAADRQRIWFITISLVFGGAALAFLLQSPNRGTGAVAALCALVLFILWTYDVGRIARFFRGVEGLTPSEDQSIAAESATLDLGIGTSWWVRKDKGGSPYRANTRTEGVVRGSVFVAQRLLTWVAIVDTMVVVLATTASIYGVTHIPNQPIEKPQTRPTYEGGIPSRSLSFYPQPGPIIYDANGDGMEDVIGLSWDSSHEEAALEVVAIDGVTLRPLWRTPPLRSQWASPRTHLLRSGDRLFLTDSESLLHIYDIRTGQERISRPSPASEEALRNICAAPSGDPRIWMATEKVGLRPKEGVIIGSDGAQAPGDLPNWCRTDTSRPTCTDASTDECITYQAVLSKGSSGYGIQENDVGVGLGPLADGIRSTHLVGYDPKSRHIRWERSIEFNGDELHADPHIDAEIHAGRLYTLYQKKDGSWVLGARDGKTGAALWSKQPPNSQRGTHFNSMTVTSARLYVVVDWKIDVFDPKTGETIGVIW